jgi:hypothetical protein
MYLRQSLGKGTKFSTPLKHVIDPNNNNKNNDNKLPCDKLIKHYSMKVYGGVDV